MTDARKRHLKAKQATYREYIEYCLRQRLAALPPTLLTVGGFAKWRVTKLDGRTASIRNKLSMLKTYITTYVGEEWLNNRDKEELNGFLKDMEYEDVAAGRSKDPLRKTHLIKIMERKNEKKWVDQYWMLALVLGYKGCLRSGELMGGIRVEDILWDWDKKGFRLRLWRTKTHRRGGHIYIHIRDSGLALSAVDRMSDWFRRNEFGAQTKDKFIFPRLVRKGKEMRIDWSTSGTQPQMSKAIKREVKAIGLNAERFAGHSLRAGMATDMFVSGHLSLSQIMKFGRWESTEMCLRYYRPKDEIAKTIFEAIEMV